MKKQKISKRRRLFIRLRNYFLTGIVIVGPISITIYLIIAFVRLLDRWFTPLIPQAADLHVSIPGLGVIIALLLLTFIGAITANFFGSALLRFGESLLSHAPVAGKVYSLLKQIFETIINQDKKSFNQVVMVEYPRKGSWAVAFVTQEKVKGQVAKQLENDELVSVFLPTTPNPTSGFLLFVPRKDIVKLDMNAEEGARLVISAGVVD